MIKLILLFLVICNGKEINLEIVSKWGKQKEKVVIQNYKIPMEEYWTLPPQNDRNLNYKIMVTQKDQIFIFKIINFVKNKDKEIVLGSSEVHANKNSKVEIARESEGKFSLSLRQVD
jgi:murein L,D-transpeptidase YafK